MVQKEAIRVLFFATLTRGVSSSYNHRYFFEIEDGDRFIPRSWKDVGAGHTRIVRALENHLYYNSPESFEDYLHLASRAIDEHLCDPNDYFCSSRVANKMFDIDTANLPGNNSKTAIDTLISQTPQMQWDPVVLESLEKLFFSTSLVELHEYPTAVLAMMQNDLLDLSTNNDVSNELSRHVAMIGYSVGMESTKEWSKIVNDRSSPYNNMIFKVGHNRRKRRWLQGDIFANALGSFDNLSERVFQEILEGDIIGALEGAIVQFYGNDPNRTLIEAALEDSVTRSLQYFAGSLLTPPPEEENNCLFPNSPFCNTTTDPTQNTTCLFPNRPWLCSVTSTPVSNPSENTNGTNPIEDTNTTCLFPNRPWLCSVTSTPVSNPSENTSGTNPTGDTTADPEEDNSGNCLFPNRPWLCSITGGN